MRPWAQLGEDGGLRERYLKSNGRMDLGLAAHPAGTAETQGVYDS
jgi:hypothetical protein